MQPLLNNQNKPVQWFSRKAGVFKNRALALAPTLPPSIPPAEPTSTCFGPYTSLPQAPWTYSPSWTFLHQLRPPSASECTTLSFYQVHCILGQGMKYCIIVVVILSTAYAGLTKFLFNLLWSYRKTFSHPSKVQMVKTWFFAFKGWTCALLIIWTNQIFFCEIQACFIIKLPSKTF